jgi:hypothetical protein
MTPHSPTTGKFTSDWIGDEMRQRIGQALGGLVEPAPPLAEPDAGGFGGGVQSASPPTGEALGDTIRRRVYGA